MNNIKIKKAQPEDAETWCKIRKECWLDVYPNEEYDITREDILLKDFDSPEKIESWQDSFINRKDCNYYSAEKDNNVVGMCLTYPDGDICEIGAIYVDVDCHHQGVGTMLMNKALADFNPTRKVNLKVVSYNDNAINFYFQEVEYPVGSAAGMKTYGNKLVRQEYPVGSAAG